MNTLQWVGLGFAAALVIFFIVAFFVAKRMTDDQRNLVRFLSALCAGFAGGLFIGDALFKMTGTLGSGAKYAISGAGGFALFFVIWFFFPKATGFPDNGAISIPEGWTFRQAVDELSQIDSAVPAYEGFKAEELEAPLRAWKLKIKNVEGAIGQLRSITANASAIRKYIVKHEDSTYRLTIVD